MSKKAADGFESYFTEKIWEMIPAIYRHEDGLAEPGVRADVNPGVLRALVELIAGHAAILRRSHDRLWEDQFIDLCSDWAVPYLADLLGTRLVSAQNFRGRRVDVAKTIYYRRRKGTPRVLEELISDISDWEGKLVENFLRLGRIRHGLDPHPQPLAGTFSGTMPGGWADLRKQRGSELAAGPFCEFYHTADMRRHRGVDGRYAIPKLAFHLFRLIAFEVGDVTPFSRTGGGFTSDPSGRYVPLFMKRNRPGALDRNRPEDWDRWHTAHEWELPAPMRCRLLDYALRSNGNINLIPGSLSVEESGVKVSREKITAANLGNWDVNVPSKRLAIDPEHGRLLFSGDPPENVKVTYHYGFSGEIGAGTYNRPDVEANTPGSEVSGGGSELSAANILNNGITQINDSATYSPVGNKNAVVKLTLQAANKQRPYLRLTRDWILNTGPNINSELILDGLWVGGNSNGPFKIILKGNYEKVLIRHCTLDPGEQNGTDANGDTIHAVPLLIDGYVEQLEIAASITGPIQIGENGILEKLSVRDSILQAIDGEPAADVVSASSLSEPLFKITRDSLTKLKEAGVPDNILEDLESLIDRVFTGEVEFLNKIKQTIDDELSDQQRLDILRFSSTAYSPTLVELNRVTVFGAIKAHRLRASDTLVTGQVEVTDTQDGCFRFSAAPKRSRLPKAYESYIIDDSHHYFTSRSFGQPGYGQLSETVPAEIERGAENGAEMGAFNMLLNPIKMDGLQAKVNEYMPFGRIPIFIEET
jgi:hypothetical protein